MKSKARRANKAEKARIDCIMKMSCVLCALTGDMRPTKLECHHIVRGNKRLGHWYTLPLCAPHHRGVGDCPPVGIYSGRHALKAFYGYDELELWQRLQVVLGLDDTLPPSKIFKRVGKGADETTAAAEPVRRPDPSMSEADVSPIGG